MGWEVSTGLTDRDKLFNAIDLLTVDDGTDPDAAEVIALQLSHAKSAAKVACNSFHKGDHPKLEVSMAGEVNSVTITVSSPVAAVTSVPVPASGNEPGIEPASEAIGEVESEITTAKKPKAAPTHKPKVKAAKPKSRKR
jgi:hypothetical protein